MGNLFSLGIKKEIDETCQMNQGYAAYLSFIADICETEEVFIARSYSNYLKILIKNWQEVHLTNSESKYLLIRISKHINQIEINPKSCLDLIHAGDINKYQNQRLALVHQALVDGIPIPENILAQYPCIFTDFRLNLDWMNDRIAKSMIPQFCDDDFSLYDHYGVLLRRQDGEVVTDRERDQIITGLDELMEFFPYLPDLFRFTKLIIVHTCGKEIYGRPDACGGFSNILHTVYLGVNDEKDQPSIHSLAHELIGHWLDYASVPGQLDLESLIANGDENIFRQCYNLSVIDALLQPQESMLARAAIEMNPFSFIGNGTINRMRPSEVFARMAEQFISNRLYQRGILNPVSVFPAVDYLDREGYWDADLWGEWLYKCAYSQIESRLDLAQKVLQITDHNPVYDGLQFGIFPWLEKLSAI